MRYQRYFHWADVVKARNEVDGFSPRKLVAAQKAIERQEAKEGGRLFRESEPTESTPLARLLAFEARNRLILQETRLKRATHWRIVRRALASLPTSRKDTLVREWNAARLPDDPSYLFCFLQTRDVPLPCVSCGVVFRWSEGTEPHAPECSWATGVRQTVQIRAEFAERRRRSGEAPVQATLF
jgi:hypothetical protein